MSSSATASNIKTGIVQSNIEKPAVLMNDSATHRCAEFCFVCVCVGGGGGGGGGGGEALKDNLDTSHITGAQCNLPLTAIAGTKFFSGTTTSINFHCHNNEQGTSS